MRSSFPKDAQVVGIVLINLFCETDNLLDNLELSNGYDFQHDMPIHIMMAKDFLFAAEFFDTMPDLLEYLDNRYVFHKNKQIHPEVLEKDFVVFHKTKYDKIKEYLENPTLGIHIKPGFADDFFSDNQHALYLRNENLKFSYLVDEIIDSFRSSIGFNPADEEPEDSPHINEMLNRGRGSEEAYKIIITELGMLSRLERKLFAESLLEKAKKADQVGFGYRIIIPNNDQTRTHFFLFCYKGERIERLNFLDAYLCMACVQHSGF